MAATLKTILGVIGNETPSSVKTFGHNEAIIALLKHFGMDVTQVTKYYKLLTDLEWINESIEDFDADVLATVENMTSHGYETESEPEICTYAPVEIDLDQIKKTSCVISPEDLANTECDEEEYEKDETNDMNKAIAEDLKARERHFKRFEKAARKANLEAKRIGYGMAQNYTLPTINLSFASVQKKSATNNLVLPITDVHYGEIVSSKATFNNNYNGEIAQKRLAFLFSEAQQTAASYGCETAYVLLGGDLISGAIHTDLDKSNEYPVLECANKVSRIFIALIKEYAKVFKKVQVMCVPGNHSRTFKKPSTKDIVRNNYEYTIFNQIDCALEEYKNVSVTIETETPYAFFNVGKQLWMLEHGDRYSTPNKIPAEIRNTLNLMHADVCVMGHWHDMFEYHVERGDAKNATVVLNGSVIGPNDFATWKIKKHSAAASKCFITDGSDIICNKTIMLDHIQG